MRVKLINLGPNDVSFIKGTMKPGSKFCVTGRGDDRRAHYVAKIWSKKVGLLRKRYIPYCIAMDDEPRTLDYMDDFDSDAFQSFLRGVLTEMKNNSLDPEMATQTILEWTGPELRVPNAEEGNELSALKPRPWLDRKFRQSPVTAQHLHLGMMDPANAQLMHGGKETPWWVVAVVVMAIAMFGMGIAIYALVNRPVIVNGEERPPFEVVDLIRMKLWMWWYG